MKRTLRGIIALTTVMLTLIMLATGAQAATPDQKVVSDYVSSMRNAVGQSSLRVDQSMSAAAQAWADHLAAVDSGNSSGNPNLYQPSGTMAYVPISAHFSRNDARAAMDTYWAGDAKTTADIDVPTYNTIGSGFAVAKSGAIYLVADLAYVKPPVVYAAPLPAPAPAPVAVPLPVAIPQPEPVQAAPVEQAPVQEDPAPAPAPEVPVPAAEAPKPTEAPKETATALATPTATATPSETASTTASEPGKNMDAPRTSDNTGPFGISKESQQAVGVGGGAPMFAGGLVLVLWNRREKKPATK